MSSWMTIPEWSDVRQVNVYHREQEKKIEQPEGLAKVDMSTHDTRREDTPFIERSTLRLNSAVEEIGQSEIAVKPENLHVLVRGTVQLPADPSAQYEIWVSADDHYQLWVDGIYQGQGPISSNSECAFYDRYPIRGLEADFSPGQAVSKAEGSLRGESRTVTIALHLYYHGRVSRSWNSADGRFGLWLSVRECTVSENDFGIQDAYMERPQQNHSSSDGGRVGGKGSPLLAQSTLPQVMEKLYRSNDQASSVSFDRRFREVACADETWRYQICKAYSGETVGYDTQFLENFDSRLWPEGWELSGYDADTARSGYDVGQSGHDAGLIVCGVEYSGDDTNYGVEDKEKGADIGKKMWGYLVPALWADYRMLPRSIQPLEEKKIFASKQWKGVVSTKSSRGAIAKESVYLDDLPEYEDRETDNSKRDADDIRLVLDFGCEITGAIVAEAVGPSGAQVLIQCGEELVDNQESLFGKKTDESFDQAVTEEANRVSKSETVSETAKQNASLLGDSRVVCVAAPQVRWDMRCGCAYQEVWTLGDGVSRLHPYDYKGFRYAQLTFPKNVELRQIYAWVRHYPMEEDACTLRCEDRNIDAASAEKKEAVSEEKLDVASAQKSESDIAAVQRNELDVVSTQRSERVSGRELEQIFEICKNAVRCCSQDAYLDCPTREKGQYLGDALITARSQVWLTGSTELLRKCIGDFILSASISPSLMAVAPGSEMQEIADYSLLFPLLPMTDYEFTGDQNFLARCYPAVRKVTESFLIYRRKDGLLENVSALWNLVDWPENLRDHYDFSLTRPVVGKGCHNVINALWYGANKVQEEMEHLLDLPVTGRCEQIAKSFHKVFYREEQSLFADSEVSAHCSIHANLYAAFFGLLPEEAQEPYVRMLRTPGRVCGVLTCYFALKSLAQMGRAQDCFDLMTRGDAYGWRNMVREGANATFEAWGKDQKWNTSLCHAWSSGFLPLFIEEIAGVHPDPKYPEGYRLEKPDVDCPSFELQVPWRGQKLRV